MSARLRLVAILTITFLLAASELGGPGSGAFALREARAQTAVPTAAPAASPASGSAAAGKALPTHDSNYYAYATRYYLQYLNSSAQAETNAKDPYYFFNYYQFYRERYAPASAARGAQGPMPAWFATMPFRNARTQSFARFVQVASPSAAPSARWVQPLRDFQRTAGR